MSVVVLTILIATSSGITTEKFNMSDMDTCMRMAEVVVKTNPSTSITNWGTAVTTQTNPSSALAIPVCNDVGPPYSADLDGDGFIFPSDYEEFKRQSQAGAPTGTPNGVK